MSSRISLPPTFTGPYSTLGILMGTSDIFIYPVSHFSLIIEISLNCHFFTPCGFGGTANQGNTASGKRFSK
jgi:hypothetical protein